MHLQASRPHTPWLPTASYVSRTGSQCGAAALGSRGWAPTMLAWLAFLRSLQHATLGVGQGGSPCRVSSGLPYSPYNIPSTRL